MARMPPRVGQRNWQYANGTLMINALFCSSLFLLSITMKPAAGINVPLPLPLSPQLPLQMPLHQQHQHQYHSHTHTHSLLHPHLQHTRSNYYENPDSDSYSDPVVGAAEGEAEEDPQTLPETEALAGLAGYSAQQHYYGSNNAAGVRHPLEDVGVVGDLAPSPYANYEPKAVTATGFVPTTHNNININNNNIQRGMHSDAYEIGGQRGKIDFVINTPNYELDGNEEHHHHQQQQQQPQAAIYYQNHYGYHQPQSHIHTHSHSQSQPPSHVPPHPPAHYPQAEPLPPLLDYPIEQFSNYRYKAAGRESPPQPPQPQHPQQQQLEHVAPQPRQLNDENTMAMAYASSMQHATMAQMQHAGYAQQRQQTLEVQPEQQDQQPVARHIVDLPNAGQGSSSSTISNTPSHHNSLPPITTSVHHNPSSTKALAGIPLSKHIEVTKHVPVTHYQKQHVPYKHLVQLRVPRPVITTIPKPIPIKVPVPQTVAVPQLQEVKIPVEKLKPFAVERPVPFVVERHVPYRVEKPITTPIYYPYPVKVPIVRTVVHKQRPIHGHRWAPLNHLLG